MVHFLSSKYRHLSGSLMLAALLLLLASGCKDDPPKPDPKETPVVTFTTHLTQSGERFGINDEFVDAAGHRVKLVALKFYLADLSLKDDNGSRTSLSDIELFDQKPMDPALNTPQWSNSYSFEVEAGSYQSIRFDAGVPATLNETDPATFDNDQPLSIYSNMYWSWASMYRFIILEAKMDTNGGSNFEHDVILHTGLNDLYRSGVELEYGFTIDSNEVVQVDLAVDWDVLFYEGSSAIDILTEHVTHTTDTPQDFSLAERFTNNFVEAFRVSPQD